MTECNKCGDDVIHVWRHRAFQSEAYREVRWVCGGCHPELPDTLKHKTDTGTDTEKVPLTDGGQVCR